MAIHRRFDLFAALALALPLGACGGSPCEDFCDAAGDCSNLGFETGANCVNNCQDSIEFTEAQTGCGAELEAIIDCAADASDACNPQECLTEAFDYLECAGFS